MSIVEKGSTPDLYLHRQAIRKEATGPLIEALARLLADTVTVHQHAHGFHWNVKGPDFAQYHALFGGIYEDLAETVDPLAECLLKIGSPAPYTLSDMITLRTMTDAVAPPPTPEAMSAVLLQMVEVLLMSLNTAFAQATAANEQGIANLVSERIDATQKWAWQLKASLGIGPA